ncbi:hypothetical protein MJH12_01945, partial [bacterium]|nr:hypothetical protein [bacterium]
MNHFDNINNLESGKDKSQAIKEIIKQHDVSKSDLLQFLNQEIKITKSKSWLDQSNKIIKWVHLNYNDPVAEVEIQDAPPIHKVRETPKKEEDENVQVALKEEAILNEKPKSKAKDLDDDKETPAILVFLGGLCLGLTAFAFYFFVFANSGKVDSFHELETQFGDKKRYDLLVTISQLQEKNKDLQSKLNTLKSMDKAKFKHLIEESQKIIKENTIKAFIKIIPNFDTFLSEFPNSNLVSQVLSKKSEMQKIGANLAMKQLISDYQDNKDS